MLRIEGLSKSFGPLQAVRDLSLSVDTGQIVGLIGPNGSGKSTLLKCIAGSHKTDQGAIHWDDQNLTDASPDQVFAAGIVLSYQDPALFQRMSALDNTLLPMQEQIGERALNAPRHGLWRSQEGRLARRASGLLSRLLLRPLQAERAANLSGGQMKLLELGRSLAGDPDLLLLDEPTAGVAPPLAYKIFEQIAELRDEGLSFLIVEHRLEILFDFVDIVYVMHLGEVIAKGTPGQIAENQEIREIYFGN